AGVGGTYCGLTTNRIGAVWQPDILYVMHDRDFKIGGMVASVIRENGLVVESSINKSISGFVNAQCTTSPDEWASRWLRDDVSMLGVGVFDYVVFMRIPDWNVTVVQIDKRLACTRLQIQPAAV